MTNVPQKLGPSTGAGAVFYFGAVGERQFATVTADVSAAVPDGFFVRIHSAWDAGRVAPDALAGIADASFDKSWTASASSYRSDRHAGGYSRPHRTADASPTTAASSARVSSRSWSSGRHTSSSRPWQVKGYVPLSYPGPRVTRALHPRAELHHHRAVRNRPIAIRDRDSRGRAAATVISSCGRACWSFGPDSGRQRWSAAVRPFVMAVRELIETEQITTARHMLDAAPAYVLGDPLVARLRSVLAPPVVKRLQKRDVDRSQEYEWLRAHGREYRGRWVALSGGKLGRQRADPSGAPAAVARHGCVRSRRCSTAWTDPRPDAQPAGRRSFHYRSIPLFGPGSRFRAHSEDLRQDRGGSAGRAHLCSARHRRGLVHVGRRCRRSCGSPAWNWRGGDDLYAARSNCRPTRTNRAGDTG